MAVNTRLERPVTPNRQSASDNIQQAIKASSGELPHTTGIDQIKADDPHIGFPVKQLDSLLNTEVFEVRIRIQYQNELAITGRRAKIHAGAKSTIGCRTHQSDPLRQFPAEPLEGVVRRGIFDHHDFFGGGDTQPHNRLNTLQREIGRTKVNNHRIKNA